MRKIGFIGAYDKTDCIIYVAKLLTSLGNKVLVIDATINQKAKYVVPVINPTQSYITEYEEIDVAVGFENMQEINEYLSIQNENEMEYTIILIDVDNISSFEKFGIAEAEKKYFVTSFDVYSLKKGLEILSQLKSPIDMTKILFSKEALKEDDDYLNFLSLGYKVTWNEYRIYFPIENGDLSVISENQRVAKIKFKKLSAQYKDSLVYITQEILKNVSESEIRRIIKNT